MNARHHSTAFCSHYWFKIAAQVSSRIIAFSSATHSKYQLFLTKELKT